MSLMDIIKGKKCDLCGKRKSDVGFSAKTGMTLCGPCKKTFRQAGGTSLRNVNRRKK
jgi:recombinational DNA repair protein (RecF pathway)